jgi:hypothetical protein
VIRSAAVGDAASLAELWRTAGLRFHPELVASELASVLGQELVLVHEEAGQITGTVFGTYDGRRGWVHRLATRPDRAGLRYGYVAARITLRVNSALADVGLTALVSRILAQAGISCNVIAALAHDHLFVAWDQGARALALLREL